MKDRIKKFNLSEEACELLKTSMSSAPVLVTPDFKKPFTLQCEASATGLGGVLFQTNDDGGEFYCLYVIQIEQSTAKLQHSRVGMLCRYPQHYQIP